MKSTKTIFSFLPSSWEVQLWRPVFLHQGGIDACNTFISICPGADATDERQSEENDIVIENDMLCSFFRAVEVLIPESMS